MCCCDIWNGLVRSVDEKQVRRPTGSQRQHRRSCRCVYCSFQSRTVLCLSSVRVNNVVCVCQCMDGGRGDGFHYWLFQLFPMVANNAATIKYYGSHYQIISKASTMIHPHDCVRAILLHRLAASAVAVEKEVVASNRRSIPFRDTNDTLRGLLDRPDRIESRPPSAYRYIRAGGCPCCPRTFASFRDKTDRSFRLHHCNRDIRRHRTSKDLRRCTLAILWLVPNSSAFPVAGVPRPMGHLGHGSCCCC